MASASVARILSASTHYDVLELTTRDGVVPRDAVRRQYKSLAVQVHPDKNRSDGAADAFKRLSEAYECLVDERTQREYLVDLTRPAERRPRPRPPRSPQRAQPPRASYFPKKQRTKKRPPPPPPSRPPPQPTGPRPWRSPEEVWAQFQKEEEEQAKREFLERGFDRDYDAPGSSRRKWCDDNVSSPPNRTPAEDDKPDVEGVETRAQDWTTWKRSRTAETQVVDDEPTVEIICCLLCRRKFPTNAALARHEQLSQLHKENLARQAAHP